MNGWIFGLGPIGQEYAKVLGHLDVEFLVIGRSQKNTEYKAFFGGASEFLKTAPAKPDFAIIAVSIDQLYEVADQVLDFGVPKILIEKPGCMYKSQIEALHNKACARGAKVYIAYNRRFLSSVQAAKQIIQQDGGVSSFHFDFTEWPSRVLAQNHPDHVLKNWFYLNSTHVLDLAFFLGGWPREMKTAQHSTLGWHTPAIFAGSGISESDAPFSYKADWGSAGRWSVEIMTSKRKLILCPLEKLKEQKIDDVNIYDIEIDDTLDQDFKPGFFLQIQAFLEDQDANLLSLQDQFKQWSFFDQIAGKRII